MDSHDKEFESLLRRFELREPRSPLLAELPEVRQIWRPRWWMVASAAAVVVAVIGGLLLTVAPEIETATVEIAGDSRYESGETIAPRSPIHSGNSKGLTLSLKDGSNIEMHPQSTLSIETAAEGQRVRLDSGSILVVASKQREGQLHVVTRDAQVSVTGTVFLVEAQPSGTRVGVFEGEVEVQNGGIVRKLLHGEQFSTDPAMKGQSLTEAIAWSQRAGEFTALLPASPIVAFTPDPIKRLVRTETIPSPEPRQPAAVQSQQEPTPSPAPAPAPQPAPPPASEAPTPQADNGADSAALQILNRACGGCHVADIAKNRHFDNRDAYAALVSQQITYGASLSQSEFQILVDYLFRTYGVRKKN